MRRYKILEHKADLKIRIFGKAKEEIFKNALWALADILKPEFLEEKSTEHLHLQSADLPSLLVDFLSEILYLTQTKRTVYSEVKFRRFTKNQIDAILFGQKVKSLEEEIKGVTYHDLDIHRDNKTGLWQATLLFDV